MNWIKPNEDSLNVILDDGNGKVILSYLDNKLLASYRFNGFGRELDSANPETAIVLVKDKPNGHNRYLIYRGDWRKELEALYPDIEKLKEHWKKHGGHFWSDSLEDKPAETGAGR